MKKCAIPELWCGVSDRIPKSKDPLVKYVRSGNKYECMKKGFGAGMAKSKKEDLPSSSLRNIKYVGEVHEENFRRDGILTLVNLTTKMNGKSAREKEEILKRILVKSDGKLDKRAFNSVLVYLHKAGIGGLPSCRKA